MSRYDCTKIFDFKHELKRHCENITDCKKCEFRRDCSNNVETIASESISKLQKWPDEHHLNREIYLYSMVSTARSILADYKRAKFKQYEFLYISNDGYLSVIEGQQKLNDKVEQLEKQLFDILVNIQEFKEEVEE